MSVSELRPGLFRLEEPDGRRRLCQAVVTGKQVTLVVDAGLPESPARSVLPLLSSLGVDGQRVVLVLSHPDADHRGGAPVLRETLPELEVWGHELDEEQLCDPEVALARRYLAFAASDGIAPAPDRLEAIRSRLGRPIRLDRALSGNTALDLGERRVEILHMPGHSPGSVVAWLPEERAAVIADAAMSRGIPFEDGGLMYPPMYAPPGAYLDTIGRLESLRPDLIVSGHEPPLEGPEVACFLAASREAADRLSLLVRGTLGSLPRTLAELCSAVADSYGDLPPDGGTSLAMTVDGIVRDLVAAGEAEVESGPPRRFRKVR